MFRLDGKIALITGAGSGIGASIATTFAEAGAVVWVTDINESAAATVAKEIVSRGGRAVSRRLDVAMEAQAAAIVSSVLLSEGHLDILVNNAGIGAVGTLVQTSRADFDRIFSVNVGGIFNLCRAFLPSMLDRQCGNIINLSSIGGVVAVRDRFAYSSSKFAVVGMTKNIALDYATRGIRCNCLCPGRVETPFMRARIEEYADPVKARAEMASTQAIGRMAQPEEIAAAALYLASSESDFITGTEFIIDGGWTAGK